MSGNDFLFTSSRKGHPTGDVRSEARVAHREKYRPPVRGEMPEYDAYVADLFRLEREDFINREYGEGIPHREYFRHHYVNYDFVLQHEMHNRDLQYLLDGVGGIPYDELEEEDYDLCAPPRPRLRSVAYYDPADDLVEAQAEMSVMVDAYYWNCYAETLPPVTLECPDCFKLIKVKKDGTPRGHKCILILEVV